MQKKVSVIIPCYNAEKTIERCLLSVINQTYSNKEVIIVNDGSSDNSVTLIDNYCNKYNYIKLINKKNGGVSSARNLALKHCTGEYVMFLDSDDNYIKNNSIEIMINTLEEKNVDCVVCGLTHPVFDTFLRGGKYDLTNPQQKFKFFNDFFVFSMPWNKVYKRKLLTHNFEEKMHFTEDELFNIANLNNFKSAYFINKKLHNYYCAPKTESCTSAINTIQLKQDDNNRNGFFFKRYDIKNLRDPVIRKEHPELAEKMINTRYIYFEVLDVEFMKYLQVPISGQYKNTVNAITSPEFINILKQCENKNLKLESDKIEVLTQKAKQFVDFVNSKQLIKQNRITYIINKFYDMFFINKKDKK